MEYPGPIRPAGVRAVLALRGDPPRGAKDYNRDADVFRHAADLVTFIREYNESGRHPDPDGFAIGVAGFPEGHPATPNRLREMDFLKAKVGCRRGLYLHPAVF